MVFIQQALSKSGDQVGVADQVLVSRYPRDKHCMNRQEAKSMRD